MQSKLLAVSLGFESHESRPFLRSRSVNVQLTMAENKGDYAVTCQNSMTGFFS